MKWFSASYDTKLVAAVDEAGALHVFERDGDTGRKNRDEIRIPPRAAKSIIADLEAVAEGGMDGYGEEEINAVTHWILRKAHHQAHY